MKQLTGSLFPKILLLATAFCLIQACATGPQKRASDPDTPPQVKKPEAKKPISQKTLEKEHESQIDKALLQAKLRLRRPHRQLGFQERRFNTCKVGAGFERTQNCRNLHFTSLNVRLRCRGTEGTVESVTNYELRNLRNRNITWKLGPDAGQSRTDAEGYMQLLAISPKSAEKSD